MRSLALFALLLPLLATTLAHARPAKSRTAKAPSTTSKPAPPVPAPTPALPEDITPNPTPLFYLDTMALAQPAQTELAKGAMGMLQPTAEQTAQLISQYTTSSQYRRILDRYSSGLYDRLRIDSYSKDEVIHANPKFFKGINNLNRRDGDSPDQEPTWNSLNQALREGTPLNPALKKFNDEILYSLSALPQIQGLVFRRKPLTRDEFASLGGMWMQSAYTSASLAFDSDRNAEVVRGEKKIGIIIIRLKQGSPISPLAFDKRDTGQTGRLSAYEVLIPPGANLKVHYKVEDTKNDLYYVFAEQI